jgi:transcriptional repressor NrdR
VPSTMVGALVTDRLRRVDQVAYVRFASVYKQFKTLEELVNEAKLVIDARRFEDPDQGKLFVEPTANGNGAARTEDGDEKPKRKAGRAKRPAGAAVPAPAAPGDE